MNDPQREARRRLEDEERIRRLREGGESMRAQLAIEEAQRSRTGRETTGFTGLTPEEEERRRLMSAERSTHPGLGETQRATMSMWGRESRGMEGRGEMTMEDRIAREIEAERRPLDVPGPTPAEQMAEMDIERRSRIVEGRQYGTAEKAAEGDLGRAGGGTYYYGGRESQAGGLASTGSSFGRSEHMPSRKPPIEAEATPMERMKGRGEGVVSTAGQVGGEAVSRTKVVGEQAVGKTRGYGRRLGEKTKEVTGGQSAEDLAAQAGESIGRGIRKVMAVGSGILSGLRRGVEESSRSSRERRRESEMEREVREEPERFEERETYRSEVSEGRETQPRREIRETEYREVRKK